VIYVVVLWALHRMTTKANCRFIIGTVYLMATEAYDQKGTFFPAGAYKVMHGSHDSILPTGFTRVYSSKDFESYKVYELRAKYFIHHRIELNAIIPINSNKSKEDSMYKPIHWFGRPNVFCWIPLN
jgi:hypothetical protein